MSTNLMRGIAKLAAAALFVSASAVGAMSAEKVRFALNTSIYTNLPIFLAIEKGYFAEEGIEAELINLKGGTSAAIPMLARNDIELAPMSGNPALFNAEGEGFALRLVAAIDETYEGWHDSTWLMVRKAAYDSGEITKLEDIRGYRVDGVAKGSSPNYWVDLALKKAGLTRDDVIYTERLSTPPDWGAALQNDAVDVVPGIEPLASLMVRDGIAERLIGVSELNSGIQQIYLASSEGFAADHHDTLVGALKAILKGRRDIAAVDGAWTPEFVEVTAKYTGMTPDVIELIPGLAYAGGNGEVDVNSLQIALDFLDDAGLITSQPDLNKLVDNGPLAEAAAALDE